MMIIDVPILRPRPDLSSAHSDGFDWILVFHHPGAHVEVVDMLLDIKVARKPREVVPVAHLVFHVVPAGLARLYPDTTTIVVGLQRPDFSDGAIMDPLDRFTKTKRIAQTEP